LAPGEPRADRVRRQIRAAAIERELSPAAAERGHAAVAVLKIEEPGHAALRRDEDVLRVSSELAERKERARRVVGVGNSAREVRPRPRAGRRARVGVDLAVLLSEKPRADGIALV